MKELEGATIAAVDILYEIIRTMPPDEGRTKWEIWDVLRAFGINELRYSRILDK
jgi:hypothetical protein